MSKLFLISVDSDRGPSILVRSDDDKGLMHTIRENLWGAYPHSIENYAGHSYDAYFGATRESISIPQGVEVEYSEIGLAEFLANKNDKGEGAAK